MLSCFTGVQRHISSLLILCLHFCHSVYSFNAFGSFDMQCSLRVVLSTVIDYVGYLIFRRFLTQH